MYKLYVDGSYNTATGDCGSGYVLLDDCGEIISKQSIPLNSDYGMHQVTGEVYAVLFALYENKDLNIDSVTIYFDYMGVKEWATGSWRAKKEHTKLYANFLKDFIKHHEVKFVKVKSHSGDYYNDMADRLAKDAANVR